MNPYLIGLRCSLCGTTHAPDEVTYTCPKDNGNLDAIYDYAHLARYLDPRAITHNPDRSLWRYAPLLPVVPPAAPHTPLAALGGSPLYRAPALERALGIRAVWMKDDSRLPSSSFKDRASAMVIARAMEMGIKTICVASTGNAAAALAALCAGTDLQAVIFVPESTPEAKLAGILIHGARVYTVRGSYNDAVALAEAACREFGWYNRSTGFNPYTREGKKTAGFEIAEQLARQDARRADSGFRAPDVVIVPVGDGNIISGVHKGFRELHMLGWIEHMPRFIGVTAALAPSFYRAWQSGGEQFETIPSQTIASGIGTDRPCDGVMALRAIRSTGGAVVEATDEEMLDAMRKLATRAGVFVEPACAAAYVGLVKGRHIGVIGNDDEVVLQLTGSGFKDVRSALRAADKPIRVESLADVQP
ncbi:MAG: threonine synthase [Chloroflexi bacterium]|jgi:threonine synthase|uniref:Threonine synthase n=1 Tax=Candidatus Thermofonsia Clade 3 bacterium TaxID=2364212 RepID=A0A2M8QB05_9CHLR|nr:threonine synthase [Candidatus Roseilinea sp. NK_OTU-006]PJF46974.1 MAG: threonine synthase [Candidatus Thermofonsia Clade 3 bacterium]RMG65173.1 MAG: threonine synthase [Chloroflexota bacterium]